MKEYGSAEFDRRQYPRLDFSIPIAFQRTAQPDDGVSSNLSLGGMMAYLPHTVSQDDVLDITMLLPCSDGKQVFKVQAQVVWVVPEHDTPEWVCRVGLRFLEIPPESFKTWRHFLLDWQGEKKDD